MSIDGDILDPDFLPGLELLVLVPLVDQLLHVRVKVGLVPLAVGKVPSLNLEEHVSFSLFFTLNSEEKSTW